MPRTSSVVLGAVATVFALLVAGLVAGSLRRPSLPTFAPTHAPPVEVGDRSVGPQLFTVDATAHDRWAYFDFSRGTVVEVGSRTSLDWDIAFQRHRVITNGGAVNLSGRAAAIELGPIPLDSTLRAPATGYVTSERRGDTPRNPVLEDWYDYNWLSHVLRPADRAYAIRTADGKHAVLRFLGYYCPGGRPGCVTFRYRYRGDGGREFPAVGGGRSGGTARSGRPDVPAP